RTAQSLGRFRLNRLLSSDGNRRHGWDDTGYGLCFQYDQPHTQDDGPLAFVEGFGVDGEAVDLGEVFLDAVFDGGGDVVDVGDGESAVHGAMAGDEDF